MTKENTHRYTLRQSIVAQILVSSIALQSLVGCAGSGDNPNDSQAADTTTETSQAPTFERMRIATVVDGVQYTVELTQGGDGISGTRTATHPDGSVTVEPVQLETGALANVVPAADQQAFVEGLSIKNATKLDHGTAYQLETSSGLGIDLEIEGDSDYVLPAAAAIILAATPALIIAVCGSVLFYSIKRCADLNRCWSVRFKWYNPSSICTGNCQTC